MRKSPLAPIDPSDYSLAQKAAAMEFFEQRQTPVFGPFESLLHSPGFMRVARSMGDYLRFQTTLAAPLREFVILLTASEWRQNYEWYIHAPIAKQVGVADEVINALKNHKRPTDLSEAESVCYDLTIELQRERRLSHATYERAVALFGTELVVDLIGLNGYYALLAMLLNTAQTPLPASAE